MVSSDLPETLETAWTNREGPVILTTVSTGGLPNSIYATCVGRWRGKFVVADNYFDKTRKNIQGGCRGAILFMTKEGKAFQIKGQLEYHESGPLFDDMKSWNPAKHPGHAALALVVDEAYTGATRLL